jgi:hypothetical protein
MKIMSPSPTGPHAVIRLHRRLAVDDEIEVLAVLVRMQRRGGVLLVVHDAGRHVVDLGELLVDEENALARLFGADQRRQLILFEYVCHCVFSCLL